MTKATSLKIILGLKSCPPELMLMLTRHTVSHVTLLVSSGKFMSGSAFFLSPPENKKAKFAFCTLKRKGGSTQKQPFLTVRFRGALLTKSVTLEFSQDTVCLGTSSVMSQVLTGKVLMVANAKQSYDLTIECKIEVTRISII